MNSPRPAYCVSPGGPGAPGAPLPSQRVTLRNHKTPVLSLIVAVIATIITPMAAIDDNARSRDDDSPLCQARQLVAPAAFDTGGRGVIVHLFMKPPSSAHLSKPYLLSKVDAEFENDLFWREHAQLLRLGWSEWQQSHNTNNAEYVDVLDPALSRVLDDASFQPSEETESKVFSYWTSKSTSPPKGVYSARVLSRDGVAHLRNLLDSATSAGIPLRRPNAMNRNGLIIDPNVDGALPLQPLVKTIEDLVDKLLRPVGRMLFPDRISCGDDINYYAFTIRYQSEADETPSATPRDVELKEHSDASVVVSVDIYSFRFLLCLACMNSRPHNLQLHTFCRV